MADVTVVSDDQEPEPEPTGDPAPVVVQPPPPLPIGDDDAADVAGAVAATAQAVAGATSLNNEISANNAEIMGKLDYITDCLDNMTARLNTLESSTETVAEVEPGDEIEEVIEPDMPPNRRHKWFQSFNELRGQ